MEKSRFARGNQQLAVAQSLLFPMSPMQILETARLRAPKIRLRDVSFILRTMERDGFVSCLTQTAVTARIYYWTEKGRRLCKQLVERSPPPLRKDIDWQLYSFVLRGTVRHLVFKTLTASAPLTATDIKHTLAHSHPMSLSQIIRALRELERAGLASSVTKRKPRRRAFSLTQLAESLGQYFQEIDACNERQKSSSFQCFANFLADILDLRKLHLLPFTPHLRTKHFNRQTAPTPLPLSALEIYLRLCSHLFTRIESTGFSCRS